MRFKTEVLQGFVLFPAILFLFAAIAIFPGAARRLRAKEMPPNQKPPAGEAQKRVSAEALRLNTLGVAYMNQGKSADAQKYFEQAIAADPDFAQAKMNLGISLLAQQKLDQARTALEQAAVLLPNDPYASYNLGLADKDSNEPEKAIAAFQHVEKIAPDEPDAFYFEGFLLSQLQKYDEAIGAFQKALAIAPYHASAQFGLARAYQRKGETDAAREGMKHFQKLTAEHLGTPFGAGYGDQGRFSLAEFAHGTDTSVPAPISVRYTPESLSQLLSTGAGAALAAGAPGSALASVPGALATAAGTFVAAAGAVTPAPGALIAAPGVFIVAPGVLIAAEGTAVAGTLDAAAAAPVEAAVPGLPAGTADCSGITSTDSVNERFSALWSAPTLTTCRVTSSPRSLRTAITTKYSQ